MREPLNDGGERAAVLSVDANLFPASIVYEGLGTVRGLVRQVMNSDGDVTVIMSPVKLRARKWRVVTAEAASAANNPYVAFVDALREVDGIDAELVDEAFYSEISRPSVTKFFIPGDEAREGSSNINIDTTDNPGEYVFENVLVGEVEVVRAMSLRPPQASEASWNLRVIPWNSISWCKHLQAVSTVGC